MQLFLGFFYFNANANSIHVKPVNGKYRIPIFLSSSVSFFLFWLSRLLSVARRHAPLSFPVPGSVPRLLVRALCQGMNNTAPRLPAASKWGVLHQDTSFGVNIGISLLRLPCQKHHRMGGVNNSNSFSHSSGGWKSKRWWQGWLFQRSLSLVCSYCLTVFSHGLFSVHVSPYYCSLLIRTPIRLD